MCLFVMQLFRRKGLLLEGICYMAWEGRKWIEKEVREKKMRKREEEEDRDEEEQILWVLNAWKNIFLDDVRQPTALDVGIIAKEQSYLSVTAIIRHESGGI